MIYATGQWGMGLIWGMGLTLPPPPTPLQDRGLVEEDSRINIHSLDRSPLALTRNCLDRSPLALTRIWQSLALTLTLTVSSPPARHTVVSSPPARHTVAIHEPH